MRCGWRWRLHYPVARARGVGTPPSFGRCVQCVSACLRLFASGGAAVLCLRLLAGRQRTCGVWGEEGDVCSSGDGCGLVMSVGDADGEPAGVTAFDGGVDEPVDVSLSLRLSLCASACVCVCVCVCVCGCGCGCVCGTALAMAADDTKAMQGVTRLVSRSEQGAEGAVSLSVCRSVSQVSKQGASSRPAAMFSPACECSSFAFFLALVSLRL